MTASWRFSLLLVLAGICPMIHGEETLASEVVEQFHQALITMMRQGQSLESRHQIILPFVVKHFDITTITRIALGRNWQSLPDDQQSSLTTLMTELITSTYAARFVSHDNQTFETVSSRPLKKGRSLVRTVLDSGENNPVNLDYQLTGKSGHWRIYDIAAGGVSDLALKRTAYGERFKSGGYDSVVEEMNKEIEKNTRSEPSTSNSRIRPWGA